MAYTPAVLRPQRAHALQPASPGPQKISSPLGISAAIPLSCSSARFCSNGTNLTTYLSPLTGFWALWFQGLCLSRSMESFSHHQWVAWCSVNVESNFKRQREVGRNFFLSLLNIWKVLFYLILETIHLAFRECFTGGIFFPISYLTSFLSKHFEVVRAKMTGSERWDDFSRVAWSEQEAKHFHSYVLPIIQCCC